MALLLCEHGWDVLARNWTTKGGELDLVVRDGGRLRFVEVKPRQPDDPVGLECVDARKLGRVRHAAEAFLLGYDDLVDEMCLMVAMVTPRDGKLDIELFDDP